MNNDNQLEKKKVRNPFGTNGQLLVVPTYLKYIVKLNLHEVSCGMSH